MGFGELIERDDAVGADDLGCGDAFAPVCAKGKTIPLFHCAGKGEGNENGAICKGALTDRCHVLAHRHCRQRYATFKGKIADVLLKGYALGERVVRHAMVRVAE